MRATHSEVEGTVATIWTQADIDALKVAVARGVQEVTYSGPPSTTVKYHSLAEMRALLNEMVAQVSRNAPYRLLSTAKGFGRSRE